MEKQFKTKQAQEAHVNKAREKYEQDCLRINAYTAQSTLVQGKDLERISVKLERAQQTVHANEREYSNFARALQDTVAKWEQEWKQFCDSCQDLEEERMEFTKDNVWIYANAVSIVCVSDDEVCAHYVIRLIMILGDDDDLHDLQSCERLRLALESFEPEKDQENFVRDYGTGNAMPDPPQFVNYSSADGAPLTSSALKFTSRPAQFTRTTQRTNRQSSAPPQQPDDEPFVNTAGVGAGNRAVNPNDPTFTHPISLSRTSTRRNPPPTNGNSNANAPTNGFSSSSSPPATAFRPAGNFPATPSAQAINPTQHELVVGENTYRVDPSKDQQTNSRAPATASKVGDETDPMMQAMANLRAPAGTNVGRSGTRKMIPADTPAASASSTTTSPTKAFTPPANISPPSRDLDYRNSAELVVGVHPATQAPHSRSTSPVPPTANFMQPPSQAPAAVDAVIDSYHQSFPGERRSRPNSRRGSFNAPQPAATPSQLQAHVQGDLLERPVSREGHAGIGANGRSRSPSLNHPTSPSLSPVPPGRARGGSVSRGDQGTSQGQYRATTPNSVGIALDPHGNVAIDSMADVYRHQQQQQQQQQQVVQARQVQQAQVPPPMQPPPPAPVQYQQPLPQPQQLQAAGGVAPRPMQRQTSINAPYGTPTAWQPSAPPPQQYAPPPPVQQQMPQHSPAYAQAPHPYANPPPSQLYHTTPAGYGMQQPQRQQTGSSGGDYYVSQHQGYAPPPQQQRQPYQQQQHQVGYGNGGYRPVSPGPVNRSPSPQPMALTQPQTQPVAEPPTRQYTEDGRGVLFYGTFFFSSFRRA